ncbi:MAG: ParA family protein [Deltaproteobacteria bacterium]|nr:ParA family protein [Deltaproteobacteria bacterium]
MKNSIISIVNAKGGVGKSTATCNLGIALSRQNKNVLVIDLDPQANTTSILIPPNINCPNTFYEYIDESAPIEKCIYPTFEKNLWCLPNVSEANNLEPNLIKKQNFEGIRKSRSFLKKTYNFILCDCPPNMGTWVMTALFGSDFVIIPNLANSTFSIDGLLKAIKLIEQIKQKENPSLKFLRLLINQVDKRKSISKFNIAQIFQYFPKNKVFETMIPTNAPFETAEAHRTTIFHEAPASNGCKAYRYLAKEIISILEDKKNRNDQTEE